MVHVPVVTSVTLLPDTVHTGRVVEVYATANPELDVAVIATGDALIATLPGCGNVMVCVP